jgi:hypothetical protein
MSFIECCAEKIYGKLLYIQISQIISFEKHIKFIPNEQWYVIHTPIGVYFTTYNMPSLIIQS